MKSSSEEGSYLRLVDVCITQLWAESNKEEEGIPVQGTWNSPFLRSASAKKRESLSIRGISRSDPSSCLFAR